MRVANPITISAIGAPSGGSLTWNNGTPVRFEDFVFLDIARQAKGWDVSGQAFTKEGDLDMTGAPATGNQRRFFVSSRGDQGDDYSHRDGLYNVFWDGGAGCTIVADLKDLEVTNDGTAQQGVAQINILSHEANRRFIFDNIAADDPPTNVRIVRDEYQSLYDAGGLFDPLMLDMLRGSTHTIRFMDMMQTNNSVIVEAEDYPQESWQNWNTVPASVLGKLCSQLGVNGWACTPHQATDDCVTQICTQIDANMTAGLKLVVELSSEIWNDSFSVTAWMLARARELWPSSTAGDSAMLRAYAAMKFVHTMKLCQTISDTRFEGLIAYQASALATAERMADALVWRDETPANGFFYIPYEKPHTYSKYIALADYFAYTSGRGDPAVSLSSAIGADFDAGNFAVAEEAFYAWSASQVQDTKNKIDECAAFAIAADTDDGTSRDLIPRTYEGGSNHSNFRGDNEGFWYKPGPWRAGVSLLEGQYATNRFLRVYRSTGLTATGTVEPMHTDGMTVNGWLDITGETIASSNDNSVRAYNAQGARLGVDGNGGGVTLYSPQPYMPDQLIQNTNGTLYEVLSAGTATEEPTHTSGAQTVGGVEYQVIPLFLNIRNSRAEVDAWLLPLFFTSRHTKDVLDLFEHQLSAGFIAPSVYTNQGRASLEGTWGKSATNADIGANRVRESGEMIRNWGKTRPAQLGGTTTSLTVDSYAFDGTPTDSFPIRVEQSLATATLPLSGTYSGDVPTDIRVRIIDAGDVEHMALSPMTLTNAQDGVWSGTVSVPSTLGPLRAEVRAGANGAPATQANSFITAGVVQGYGQSNIVFFWDTFSNPRISANVNSFELENGVYRNPRGDGIITLLDTLVEETGIPWVGIQAGQGGTPIGGLDGVASGPFDSSTVPFDNMVADIARIGRKPNLVLFHQGEGNTPNATIEGYSDYASIWDSIWQDVEALYPEDTGEMPKFISSLATYGGGEGTGSSENITDFSWSVVDQYHFNLVADKSDVYWGGSWRNASRLDSFHAYSTSYSRRALQNAQHILAWYELAPDYTPFQIATVSIVSATQTRVIVSHGQGTAMALIDVIAGQEDLGPTPTQVRGFEVAATDSYVDAVGVIENGTQILLTHADIGTGSRNLRHLFGRLPDTSGMVVDNSAAGVPLLHTANTPIAAT